MNKQGRASVQMLAAVIVILGLTIVVLYSFLSEPDHATNSKNPTAPANYYEQQAREEQLWGAAIAAKKSADPAAVQAAYGRLLAEFDQTYYHLEYGEWLMKQGQYEDALAQIEPMHYEVYRGEVGTLNSPKYLYQLAELYRLTGQPDKEKEIYIRAAALGPFSKGAHKPELKYTGSDSVKAKAMIKAWIAVTRIGHYSVHDPGFPVAERLMREALALAPNWPELLYYAGWVMMNRRHWYEAEELYDKADALSDDPKLEHAIEYDMRRVTSAIIYIQQHSAQQP